jgi:hypothetical protein
VHSISPFYDVRHHMLHIACIHSNTYATSQPSILTSLNSLLHCVDPVLGQQSLSANLGCLLPYYLDPYAHKNSCSKSMSSYTVASTVTVITLLSFILFLWYCTVVFFFNASSWFCVSSSHLWGLITLHRRFGAVWCAVVSCVVVCHIDMTSVEWPRPDCNGCAQLWGTPALCHLSFSQ